MSTKRAFAVTEKGHKFDAERAAMRREHALNEARLAQEYEALGHKDPETGKNPAKLLNVLRFNTSSDELYPHPTSGARHQAYVQQQHAEGSNAWNPFGGALTPLPEEAGGTPGFFGHIGKVMPKSKTASINFGSFTDELQSIFQKTAAPLAAIHAATIDKEAFAGLGASAGRAGVNLAVGGASRARALASRAMPAATKAPAAAATSVAPAAAARKVLPSNRPAVPAPMFGVHQPTAALMGA